MCFPMKKDINLVKALVPAVVIEAPPNTVFLDIDDCGGSSPGSSYDIGFWMVVKSCHRTIWLCLMRILIYRKNLTVSTHLHQGPARPVKVDRGKGIMLEDEGQCMPLLGLTMGPVCIGMAGKGKVDTMDSDLAGSSSDENIFLGACRI
ncbi:unnamed protein product [Arabis nemorensis]|uniref:Uncharacterized protein n=1 Tax=Arabis nemorensis TaxID=586526 RepID=A0A565BTK5_9BRAS|nr:unnamed protein product [Arabis nemorensis]